MSTLNSKDRGKWRSGRWALVHMGRAPLDQHGWAYPKDGQRRYVDAVYQAFAQLAQERKQQAAIKQST